MMDRVRARRIHNLRMPAQSSFDEMTLNGGVLAHDDLIFLAVDDALDRRDLDLRQGRPRIRQHDLADRLQCLALCRRRFFVDIKIR